MAKKIILGIDAGCNRVKVVGEKGATSFLALTVPKGNRREFKNMESDTKFEIVFEGRTYALGEYANFIGKEDSIDIIGSGAKNNKTAFIRAIGGICAYVNEYLDFEDDVIEVFFNYGSPIINASDEDEVKQIEKRFTEKDIEITYNGIPLTIKVKDVHVFPEGISAYASMDFDDEKEVHIVDPGSASINFAKLVNGSPQPGKIDNLQNGVEYYKETYLEFAAEELADKIYAKIKQMKWESGVKIYCCGGYAEEVTTAFNKSYGEEYQMVVMTPEVTLGKKTKKLTPLYANAAGLYSLATMIFTPALKG